MRKLILILLLTIAAAGTWAQSFDYDKADAKLWRFWPGTDTLTGDTTLIREYPYELQTTNWRYYFSLDADSLSGDQSGSAVIEYSYLYEPETWIPLDTLIFKGAGTYSTTLTNRTSTDAYMPLKLRITVDMASGVMRLSDGWVLLKR